MKQDYIDKRNNRCENRNPKNIQLPNKKRDSILPKYTGIKSYLVHFLHAEISGNWFTQWIEDYLFNFFKWKYTVTSPLNQCYTKYLYILWKKFTKKIKRPKEIKEYLRSCLSLHFLNYLGYLQQFNNSAGSLSWEFVGLLRSNQNVHLKPKLHL